MARETYVWRDGQMIPKHAAPPRAGGIQIIKDIQPYKDVAVDGRVVGSRRERREMMRDHGLVEVGNETKARPLPRENYRDAPDRSLISELKRNMGLL